MTLKANEIPTFAEGIAMVITSLKGDRELHSALH